MRISCFQRCDLRWMLEGLSGSAVGVPIPRSQNPRDFSNPSRNHWESELVERVGETFATCFDTHTLSFPHRPSYPSNICGYLSRIYVDLSRESIEVVVEVRYEEEEEEEDAFRKGWISRSEER